MKRYHVKVIPRSSKNQILQLDERELKIKLMAPPVDGRANDLLIELLADHFNLRKSQIKIITGFNGRNKIIEVG